MSLSEKVNNVLGTLANVQRQVTAFENGTKVSATRARVSLSDAAKQISVLRKSILEVSKAMPTKSKVKKADSSLCDVVEVPEIEEVPELKRCVSSIPEEPLIERPKKERKRPKALKKA